MTSRLPPQGEGVYLYIGQNQVAASLMHGMNDTRIRRIDDPSSTWDREERAEVARRPGHA
jgi:hypothetical protein